MHILIVYAHPEPKSFNAALKEAAVETLAQAGHEVRVSDLYAQGFKARIDIGDFLKPANPEQLNILAEGANALATGTFLEEIKKEQEKVVWADLVIFQFPLWWFSMPSIIKGWVDRVFTLGFAFDIANGRLYENGLFKGKKAMLSLTTGGPEIGYTPNGRAGDILAVLWPIHSGAFRWLRRAAAVCGIQCAHGIGRRAASTTGRVPEASARD